MPHLATLRGKKSITEQKNTVYVFMSNGCHGWSASRSYFATRRTATDIRWHATLFFSLLLMMGHF